MAKKVIKAEIYGKENEGNQALMSLIKRLEERQHDWHASHPVNDGPESCRPRLPGPDEKPLCLTLAMEAKRMVGMMSFD